MENTKTTISKGTCSLSNTRMLQGENNEIICLKIYNGDWGDWDEKPANNIQHNIDADNNSIDAQF
ncbi:hypothetical protein [Flavobacterium ginsengiterrae]|uniref:Uncharacterized protein n=1 Tax=Flavobacterium ginsengiterrae TaxID=871695 RepID=A0ABP7G7D3_9FLAO